MKIRRIISAALIVVIVVSSFFTIFAKKDEKAKIKNLTVLGDGVCAPYISAQGTEVYLSYVDLLSEYYGLVPDEDLFDLSRNGMTLKDMLGLLSDDASMREALAASDVVVLSVGGADVLDFLLPYVSEMLGLDYGKIDVSQILKTLVEMDDDTLDKFSGKTITFDKDNKKALDDLYKSFSENYSKLASEIRKISKDAQIYIFTVFDPLLDMPAYTSVKSLDVDVVAPLLKKINEAIKKQTESDGIYCVDIASEFALKKNDCTCVSEYKLLPNSYGHTIISSALTYEIDSVYRLMNNEAAAPVFEKGKDLWLWFALAVVVLATAVPITVFFAKTSGPSNKKQGTKK